MENQIYLGCQNGMVFCVDSYDTISVQGRAYHLYDEDPIIINSYKDFFLKGEQFFDEIACPRASFSNHDFDDKNISTSMREGLKKMKKDEEILEEHGEQGTFIVRVQHRQHSSWQGRVTWVDENKTVYFRSELELMKLIDGALNEKVFEEKEDTE
ncbi:hypothetical protein [Agathobacter sp.]|uniref:hypothetical protein n=1 Tax=Agathobacter sp. TaxID=2021311 RepID=UPI00257D887F|nr:hypothetical protein [Agathobacter sp.]